MSDQHHAVLSGVLLPLAAIALGPLALGATGQARAGAALDLVAVGRLVSWTSPRAEAVPAAAVADLPADAWGVGVVWQDERDVREIRARFAGAVDADAIRVQYWARTWPPDPPKMPAIEDPQDDLWRGSWLTARLDHAVRDDEHVFTFRPLAHDENKLAGNLPGVDYRRTLKVRLVLPTGTPRIDSLAMHSESVLQPLALRIEFGAGEADPATWSGRLEIRDGTIGSVKPWNFGPADTFEAPCAWKNVRPTEPKGIIAELLVSEPSPPGSYDITVVTVWNTAHSARGDEPRTFSFSPLDLDRGPIYVPDMHVVVNKADKPRHFSPDYPPRGRTIREQIRLEPEQTFERASREIPPQDPWVRQHGDKVYLPVAADASWQKFAVEYGGDMFISKRQTKAKGAELKRLQWKGDVIRFRVGTMRIDGAATQPYYREDRRAKVSVAEDCLPIVANHWEQDGLTYEQEAFATLLTGPLDPNDPRRSEQTPAALMMQLRVRNPGVKPARAACVLTIEEHEDLELEGRRVYGGSDSRRLRMVIRPPARAATEAPKNGSVVSQLDVAPGAAEDLLLYVPFVSDLDDAQAAAMESLDYDRERRRVADYWRGLIDRTTRFTTPEAEFNHVARFVVPHIHISTTKDPKSGLYMVPAASYGYQVFANECCFQTLLLDALGDTERAGQYLKTLTELQGTRSFPGNYPGPYDGVFHGAKVDDEYDYTASNYGLDHGTVLWALARHYFYTRDAAWREATLPRMLKAIEWIERQRAATRRTDAAGEKVLEYGLLPAGHLEDNSDWGYWYAVNAYCAAGMIETAAAMADLRHPDAEKIRRQAETYRDDLRRSVLRCSELAPVTRMRDGTYSPYVPTRCGQRFRCFGPLRVQYYSRYGKPDMLPCYRLSATREVLYGPMILLNLQVFDVHEPIAEWILDDWEDNLTLSSAGGFNVHGFTDDAYWFSQGGMVFQSNLQNPIFAYLLRGETPAAIRGLYNGMAACLYPEVHTFTEEYREWRHASGPFYKSPDEARFVNRVRDALVLESGDDLLLAVGAPRRWLASGPGIQVDRINSVFGPVAYTLRAGDEPRTVVANVTPPTRNPPKNIWLHVRLPDHAKIQAVQLNGQKWTQFDATAERIALPADAGPSSIVIRY
ncbi:MAG: hypothetical protein HY718_00340 [Planctomycetes bacterium]|nr:hypothetical protein [Planctomycetota bacterium]